VRAAGQVAGGRARPLGGRAGDASRQAGVAGRVKQAVDRRGVEVGGDPRIAFKRVGERDAVGPGGVADDLVSRLPADGQAQREHDLF